jgi:hypothetical protein
MTLLTDSTYFVINEATHEITFVTDDPQGFQWSIPHVCVKTGPGTYDESRPASEQFRILFDGSKYWTEPLAQGEAPSPWWKLW